MPFEIDEYKLKEASKPKQLTEKSKDVVDDFFSVIIKWATIIIFGLVFLDITIYVFGALIGILNFGWKQL